MNDYLSLLILAYFKKNQEGYSFLNLSRMLGISLELLEELIESHIDNGYLGYVNNMLSLLPNGRLLIMNKAVDSLDFSEENIEVDIIDSSNAWPLDRPYVPEKFTSKL